MIKAVIFDLGGVLLNLDMPLCIEKFKALGMDTDSMMGGGGSTICDGIRASGAMDAYQVGAISTEDFFLASQSQCVPGTTREQVLEAWNACLLDIPVYKLDYILELRRRGYRTYMLSNTNESHWNTIREVNFPLPPEEYFDDLFLSQELHLAKPGKEIYTEVVRRIGLAPEECLFLDDSQPNVDAAGDMGIHVYKTPLRTDWRGDIDRILSKDC